MLMSVATMALPHLGTTVSLAAYRSNPAAKALPLVGARALSLSSSTCRACSAAAAAAMLGATGAGGCSADMAELASGVGVAAPLSVVRGRVEVGSSGAGSITFVRLGRGDAGRDGGSWVGAGVLASVDMVGEYLCVCLVGGQERGWGGANEDATRFAKMWLRLCSCLWRLRCCERLCRVGFCFTSVDVRMCYCFIRCRW